MKTRINTRRRALLASAAAPVIALALWAGPAGAQEAAARSFTIAPQPLADALLQLSRQADIDIVAAAHLTRGRTAPQVTGEMPTDQAMAMLLAGSGLQAVPSTSGYVLARASDPQSGSAAGGGAEVEALIVTAQKREEDIQDVPIAISAFSQEDLTRSQIAGGPDLITQVPNMTFTKTNFSSYSVQLRGIGTQAISATTDPAVAIAFNNTPFIRNRFFEQEFYDLQRVEVLRGPQGTLYGRNATAGVVNIISQKPKFLAEAKASGDVSNYSSSRLEGMVNIPLVEDKIALRLAGAWTKREGYSVNELTGNPIDGRDLWSTRLSLRAQPTDQLDINLIWEHFEEEDDRLRSGKQLCKKDLVTEVAGFDVRSVDANGDGFISKDEQYKLPNSGQASSLMATPGSNFSQGCERNSLYAPDSFETPNGLMLPYYIPVGAIGVDTALPDPYASTVQSLDLRTIESTIDPKYRASADIGELQVSFDLTDTLTLQSETAYGVDSVYSLQDFNRFNTAPGAWLARFTTAPFQPTTALTRGVVNEEGVFCDPQLGCSDRLVAVDISTAKARQFSQELRLSSDFDGPFNFSLGANYLRADSEDKYYVFINSLTFVSVNSIAARQLTYQGPTTDNIACLKNGYLPGDPEAVYSVNDCVYVDPNPIDQVNDLGHNYFLSKNPYKLISYAVFGEAYYNITDALKVTAGLRWTVDKKEAPRVPTWLLASNSVGYPVAEVIEQEWREPTGRLTLDWKPDLPFTDDTMIYASYAHGYKAGGANPPGFVRAYYSNVLVARANAAESATRPRVFDPEYVDAYEVGTKNVLADGKVTLNLAAFYYDYTDYQISEIVDRSAFNRNFDATVWGIELEADWRPLENLRLGLKGGYESARVADGERAIDLMDRTAGDPNWMVVRPFPTFASSCILPTWLMIGNNVGTTRPVLLGSGPGGGLTGCELAYGVGVDPVTRQPYVLNPAPSSLGNAHAGGPIDYSVWSTDLADFPGWPTGVPLGTAYPGWNPETAPNGGEGIFKDIGGNPLPNAPDWTATITADYTIPLPSEWLATLHTDLHWQAESWWRVFDDHEYGKLDEYFTMNLAAIFTNEERGWNIMAYIKNVTDETAITGAFLNSDDTGLTTNVFLTEPRLYGLRVTKAWTGGSTWGPFGARREGPFPLTVEIAGQVQRHDAPNSHLSSSLAGAFEGPLAIFDDTQDDELDWGDGRDAKVIWRPAGGYSVSAGVRYGRTNNRSELVAVDATEPVCAFGGYYEFLCEAYAQHPIFGPFTKFSVDNNAFSRTWDREIHTVVDFAVGKDIGIGGLAYSTIAAGVRYAEFQSETKGELRGAPDWVIPEGFYPSQSITHTTYDIEVEADRTFSGWGPQVSWSAATALFDGGDAGLLAIDWSVEGGVLFGTQEASVKDSQRAVTLTQAADQVVFEDRVQPQPVLAYLDPVVQAPRSEDVTVPNVGVSLGLSYSVGAFKAGLGYRWERYFDVIDGGYDEHRSEDRTIDGPYFKIAVGFGG
jgi:outer membrane receptor protein involved in Fe transport